MSTHIELPYTDEAIRCVTNLRDVVGLWSHFRLLSVDGLSPVLVYGRQNRDETIVRVVTMTDGRNGYWRTPDARYIRKFAAMVAADAGQILTSDRVDRSDSPTIWTYRFRTRATCEGCGTPITPGEDCPNYGFGAEHA